MDKLWSLIKTEDNSEEKQIQTETLKGLFDLPEELLLTILGYLSVNDLVACSLVSKFWRVGVNIDCMWKEICRNERYTEKFLNQVSSHLYIEPDKNDNESASDEDALPQLCYWRRVYGRFKELENNWIRQKFERHRLSDSTSPVLCLDCDGVTAVTGHEDSSIDIWSVISMPYLVQKIFAAVSEYPVTSVRTTTHYVIAVQNKLLLVYMRKDHVYSLTDMKSFQLGEENIEQMEKFKTLGGDYSSWYKEALRVGEDNTGLTLLYTILEDQLYVACSGIGSLKFWTLPGSQFVSGKAGLAGIQQIESDGVDIYLVIRTEVTHLLKYDREEDAIKTLLLVPGHKRFVIGDDLIMALSLPSDIHLKRIWVWVKDNYAQPVSTKALASSNFSAILSRSGNVIISEESTIQVWNPLCSKSVVIFSVGSGVDFIKEGFGSTVVVFMRSSLHLWDWKSGKRLYRFHTELEWTSNYKNLVWVNCSILLSASARHQLEVLSFL